MLNAFFFWNNVYFFIFHKLKSVSNYHVCIEYNYKYVKGEGTNTTLGTYQRTGGGRVQPEQIQANREKGDQKSKLLKESDFFNDP